MRYAGWLTLQSKNYEVFFSEAAKIPNILHEIGVFEITFREVGEGTNEPIDLDKHDQYYHHFLWDNEANKIAGAYRMDWVLKYTKVRNKWFYLNDLFRLNQNYDMMHKSIEMGRALSSKNTNKTNATFLLWKNHAYHFALSRTQIFVGRRY
jgi:hypothetical protein